MAVCYETERQLIIIFRLGGMILSMRFLKTLVYSFNLWKTVCVYGTKASLVWFSPIETCVNIGSSHQVTFCSLSSLLVFLPLL